MLLALFFLSLSKLHFQVFIFSLLQGFYIFLWFVGVKAAHCLPKIVLLIKRNEHFKFLMIFHVKTYFCFSSYVSD